MKLIKLLNKILNKVGLHLIPIGHEQKVRALASVLNRELSEDIRSHILEKTRERLSRKKVA